MTVTRGQYLIGKMLGSCVLEKPLGHGGSSAVFLAQQKKPECKVAVKVFLPRAGMDARMLRDFYRRFLREAEAASKLDHDNILPIYSYGEQDGLPYIVMPYMPGGTLDDYMSRRGPLSLQEAQWYLDQLAAALDYAHEQGCVHCDVKPANILLDSDGHVMLSDFGIARLAKSDIDPEQTEAAHQEALMGTPDYISPEQALGRPLDGRSDIYSLGVTLFFVLAKRLPFRADTTIALALQHVHEPPPSLSLIRADVTPAIDRVIRRALAKDPNDRFQSASDFSVAFANAVLLDEKKIAHPFGRSIGIFADDEPFDVPSSSQAVGKHISILYRPRIRRMVTLCLTLLLVLAGAGFALTSVLGQIPQESAQGKTKVVKTIVPVAPFDGNSTNLLLDEKNWPKGDVTYKFDEQKHQYRIINTSAQSVALAPYYGFSYQNFHLTVAMTELKDSQDDFGFYGVIFRLSPEQSSYYLFEISSLASPQYAFMRYQAGKWITIKSGLVSSLNTGLGVTNKLTVVAQNNQFSFQINDQPVFVGMVKDANAGPLLAGNVGLYVEKENMEVVFSNLEMHVL